MIVGIGKAGNPDVMDGVHDVSITALGPLSCLLVDFLFFPVDDNDGCLACGPPVSSCGVSCLTRSASASPATVRRSRGLVEQPC